MLLVLFYRYASYLLLQLPIFPFKVSLHLWEEQKEISSEILQGGSDLPAPCPCLGKRLHGPGEASAVRGATLPKQIKSFILFFSPQTISEQKTLPPAASAHSEDALQHTGWKLTAAAGMP